MTMYRVSNLSFERKALSKKMNGHSYSKESTLENTKSLIPKKLQESDVDITDMFGVFRSKSGVFSAARSIFKANHAKILNEIYEVEMMQEEEKAEYHRRKEAERQQARFEAERKLRHKIQQENEQETLIAMKEEGKEEEQEEQRVESTAVAPQQNSSRDFVHTISSTSPTASSTTTDKPQTESNDRSLLPIAKGIRQGSYKPPPLPKKIEAKEPVASFSAPDAKDLNLDLSHVMKVGPLVLEDIEDGPEVVGKEPVFLWPKVEGVDGVAALNKFYGDHTTASRSIHQRAAKVLIIFYSMFGDVERVVKHLRTGVQKVPKCEVEIFQVPETLTETELNVLGATPKSFYPVLDADCFDKLRAADGILLAFPASSTGVPTQIRAFFNSLHNLAKQNVLLGKLAGIASSPLSSTHGMELVRTELTTDMAHCGLISIPLKPSEKTAVNDATNQDKQRRLNPDDLLDAVQQGEQFAVAVQKYVK